MNLLQNSNYSLNILFLPFLSDFSPADWSRAMFENSTDVEMTWWWCNLFFSCARDCPRNVTKMDVYEAVFLSKIRFTVQIQLCLLVIQLCPFVIQLCLLVIQLCLSIITIICLLVIQLLYFIMPACHSIMSVCLSIMSSCHSISSACYLIMSA